MDSGCLNIKKNVYICIIKFKKKVNRMETEETKVFLTELEKLKIEEFNKEKEGLNQLYFRIGELETQLSLLKKESVEKTVQASQNEQKIIAELREKYGQFQLGENFEVIKNGGDN